MIFENITTKEVVLAVPVNIDTISRKNLCKLLRKSGIEVVQTVSSPVLSGVGYCHSFKKEGLTFIMPIKG